MEYRDRRQPDHKWLTKGHGVSGYVPYIQQSGTTAGTQSNLGTTQNQNTFTPGQTNLQGNLGNLWQSFLQGNIPSSFTNPAAATNAYNTNFQSQVAPQIASQYGAGSPQLASQNALGLANLQGQLYNTGVGNFMNALTGGTNYAINSPTGNQQATTGQAASAGASTDTSGINPLAFALQALMSGTSGFSDERLKENIEPINKAEALEQIKKLRSVEFNWREEASEDRRLQLGFIAQEVEDIIPEAVSKLDDIYLLDKGVIIPVLVAAVQELSERLERLEK